VLQSFSAIVLYPLSTSARAATLPLGNATIGTAALGDTMSQTPPLRMSFGDELPARSEQDVFQTPDRHLLAGRSFEGIAISRAFREVEDIVLENGLDEITYLTADGRPILNASQAALRDHPRLVLEIPVGSEDQIISMVENLSWEALPSELSAIQFLQSTLATPWGIARRAVAMNRPVVVFQENGSARQSKLLVENVGEELHLSLEGRRRLTIAPRSITMDVSGLPREDIGELVRIVSELDPARLRDADIRIENLTGVSLPLVERLTYSAMAAGCARLQIGDWITFSNAIPANRRHIGKHYNGLRYRVDASANVVPLKSITQIVARYMAFETSEILRISAGEAIGPDPEALFGVWMGAIAHAQTYLQGIHRSSSISYENGRVGAAMRKAEEAEEYEAYISDRDSVARWVAGLEAMARNAASPLNARRVRNLLSWIWSDSQPTAGSLLGYEPFDGRALQDNAFELIRIAGRSSNLGHLSELDGVLGQQGSVRVGGAVLGIHYNAFVRRERSSITEWNALRDQIRALRHSSRPHRITVVPEDNRCGTGGSITTPEWIVESGTVGDDGRWSGTTRLATVEVKEGDAARLTDRDNSVSANLSKALRQVTEHPFVNGVAQPDALIVFRLYNVVDASALVERLKRDLDWEYSDRERALTALQRNRQAPNFRDRWNRLRSSLERLKRTRVMIVFEGKSAAQSGIAHLRFQEPHWHPVAEAEWPYSRSG
jgi:hypothetical protein